MYKRQIYNEYNGDPEKLHEAIERTERIKFMGEILLNFLDYKPQTRDNIRSIMNYEVIPNRKMKYFYIVALSYVHRMYEHNALFRRKLNQFFEDCEKVLGEKYREKIEMAKKKMMMVRL